MSKVKFKALSTQRIINLYSRDNGGPLATRDLLGFYVREGLILCRCKERWISDEADIPTAWKRRPETLAIAANQKERLLTVSKREWNQSVDWVSDRENWQVKNGRIAISLKGGRFLMIKGLRFHGGMVKDMFHPKSKKRPGKSTDKLQWRMFWHEVIRYIQDGREDFGRLQSKPMSSNEKLAKTVYEEHEDNKIAADLEKRLTFNLSYAEVLKEVKALRKEFGLTRTSAVK